LPAPAEPAVGPRPFALHEAGAGGLRIVAANGAARAMGITAGLTLSDAKARAGHLDSEPIDRAGDRAALIRLAAWMGRFTPRVALNGEDGLLLETTGCDHLFGGERAMLAAIGAPLTAAGYHHRMGLAATPGAAAALAHGHDGPEPPLLAAGETAQGLAGLPMAALRLTPDALTLLRRFGLTRIGQLYGIDRKALARRFQSRAAAGQVMDVLDAALGRRATALTPLTPPPDHAARLPCPEPLIDRTGLQAGLERLTAEVCAMLTANGQGARRFTLTAFRADGTLDSCIAEAARPVRMPAHILRLFAERLDGLDPGYGIDLLHLEARRCAPMEAGMGALCAGLAMGGVDIAELAGLADRLCARLGAGRVEVLEPAGSHLPERACQPRPFAGHCPDWAGARPAIAAAGMGPRPLTRLVHPEPVEVIAEVPDGPPLRFVWRRLARRVVRADGPERIAPEWWHHLPAGTPRPPGADAPEGASKAWLVPKMDPRADASHIEAARAALAAAPSTGGATPEGAPRPRTRDYYRVEDGDGRRYWLFRDGLYGDGRGGRPQWYVHGVGP